MTEQPQGAGSEYLVPGMQVRTIQMGVPEDNQMDVLTIAKDMVKLRHPGWHVAAVVNIRLYQIVDVVPGDVPEPVIRRVRMTEAIQSGQELTPAGWLVDVHICTPITETEGATPC